MKNSIRIFCPATVANVSCGYDVLGFCLDGIGDIMTITKTETKGIKLFHHDQFNLSLDPNLNVAGISALAMLKDLKPNCGFTIEIDKKIKPGSGIGSSAASATGSVYGINKLLGNPCSKLDLVHYAMKGESFASLCEHADNLAPALYGGFTLVKSIDPMRILQLPSPPELYATILHPQIEIKTSDSKSILPLNITMKNAITQWANVGSFVHALHTNNYELLRDSLIDVVVEPYRSKLIPHFNLAKKVALQTGALGCGISGSGPSLFMLSKGQEIAIKVERALIDVYKATTINFSSHVSRINSEGIKEC